MISPLQPSNRKDGCEDGQQGSPRPYLLDAEVRRKHIYIGVSNLSNPSNLKLA
jgi:hypothetical protein